MGSVSWPACCGELADQKASKAASAGDFFVWPDNDATNSAATMPIAAEGRQVMRGPMSEGV
jgi:hypothetical protein